MAKQPAATNRVGDYRPKIKTVKIPRPGGVTMPNPGTTSAPTKPEATPALHKQYAAGTRVLKNPKTQGRTSQGKQIN